MSATEISNYGYDAAGRITGLSQQLYRPSDNNPANSGISLGTNSWTVGYDPVGRITSFIDTTAATSTTGPATATFSYDSNGNRNASTQSTTAGTATSSTRSYNVAAASNRLLGYTQTAVVSGSTSTSTVSYVYNAAGDITSQGSKTFSFNAESRLSSMATGSTVTSPTTYYTHNALGQRVFKTEPTTGTATTATSGFAFVYDEDGNLLGEYGTGGASSTGTTEYIWLPTPNGPMPVATVINGTLFAVHSDNLNTPRRLSNTAAQAVWQWKYSAFGDEQPTIARNRFANTKTNPNPGTTTVAPVTFNLRYPGQYADAESGLNYNYFRSYDSNSGRYTQADPIGLDGGWNRFGYVVGNPLIATDALGLQTTIDAAIRNAIGKGDVAELRALAEAANPQQAASIQRALTPARDLIRGQTKRSASYASELEGLSYAEICQTAKGGGELAKKASQMKKLIEQQERLLAK